jgi:hypothetical protein
MDDLELSLGQQPFEEVVVDQTGVQDAAYYPEGVAIEAGSLPEGGAASELAQTANPVEPEMVIHDMRRPVKFVEHDDEPDPVTVSYAQRLYGALGQIAGMKIPDRAINGILNHFPGWQYETVVIGGESSSKQVRFLRRQIMDSAVELQLVPQQDPRRKVWIGPEGLTIQVDDVTVSDLRYLLHIEKRLFNFQPADEITIHSADKGSNFSGLAKEFRQAKDVRLNDDDLFTEKESVAMSLMTYCNNNEDLADILRTSGATISRLLRPVIERLGITSLGTTSTTDLTLIAVAAGVASIDHLPKGKTEVLSDSDTDFLADYFGPDLEKQAELRSKPTSSGPRLSRIYSKLGLQGPQGRLAVLYAVRDEVIELPTVQELRRRMVETANT